MKCVYKFVGLLLLLLGIGGVLVATGAYNVAADEPHWAITRTVIEKVRNRAIAARASAIAVPALDGEGLGASGAGNYDAMCAGCHLEPGVNSSEMSRGLNPAPPNLAAHPVTDPAAAFWIIKHGIKMTGMPAWGKSMEDEYVWGLVAFLKRLPELTPETYHELVEASGGHHHGGHHHHDEHEPGDES